MEGPCPLFTGSLTKKNVKDMEEVQKMAFRIILRGKYQSYENALNVLEQDTLEDRREFLTLRFAKKNFCHPKLKHLFQRSSNLQTRRGLRFKETFYKTRRGTNEPINYMVRLLNNYMASVK